MKKTKNAFTLIELLAVIVILAIIALIATPIVLGIVERARKSALENTAYGLMESAKLQYTEGLLDGTNGVNVYDFRALLKVCSPPQVLFKKNATEFGIK